MKIVILAVLLLLSACAPAQPAASPTPASPVPTSVPAKPAAASPAAAPSASPAASPAAALPSPQATTSQVAAAPGSLGKVMLATSVVTTFEFLPAYIGVDRGMWSKRGLEIEIVSFPGDAPMQQAFAANRVDMGLGAASVTLAAVQKGLDTRLVASLSNSVSYMGFVAGPGIESVDDLRGKTVGVTSPNSITDLLVKGLSQKLTGNADSGIRRAALGGLDAQIAALKTGQTQGFVWTLEGAFQAQKQGVGKYLFSFGDQFPHFAFEMIIAKKPLIDQKPQVVRAFLDGWYEAQAYMRANKDYSVQMFQKYMSIDPDIGAAVYEVDMKAMTPDGAFDDDALQAAAQTLVDTAVIKSIPSLETWVDKRFVPVRVNP
jgi:ABC-type nitrate/sulfonate/bicarbonate transport system substrate-binding protein